MERKMRRFRQLLSDEMAKAILLNGTNGVLSVVDADGAPYGVPLSYVYDGDNQIYFHSAVSGHKIDCIKGGSQRCSFCVIAKDQIMPEEFTTYFRSVIAKGSIHIVTDSEEIHHGLRLLCDKYSPGIDSAEEIAGALHRVVVLRFDIECLTGKEAIELVRERARNNTGR